MKFIKVEYEVMIFILDVRELEGNKILIYEEDDLFCLFDFGLDVIKNIVLREKMGKGDVEKEFKESDVIVEYFYMI